MPTLNPSSSVTLGDPLPTARERLLEQAEQSYPNGFRVLSQPAHSIQPLVFDVVAGAGAAGYAIARAGQVLTFFAYAKQGNVATGLITPTNVVATDYHTNLTEPRAVPGGRAMAIEAISATAAGKRVLWAEADRPDGLTDAAVINAYSGLGLVADPSSFMSPPEFDSPAMLEELVYERVIPAMVMEIVLNETDVRQIGLLDQVPEGTGKAYLRAHGAPEIQNRFVLSEGIVWQGTSASVDKYLQINATLKRDVVVPITGLSAVGGVPPVEPDTFFPQRLIVDIRMRLHGLQIGPSSAN